MRIVKLELGTTVVIVVEGGSGWTIGIKGVVAGSDEARCCRVVEEATVGFLVVADKDCGD